MRAPGRALGFHTRSPLLVLVGFFLVRHPSVSRLLFTGFCVLNLECLSVFSSPLIARFPCAFSPLFSPFSPRRFLNHVRAKKTKQNIKMPFRVRLFEIREKQKLVIFGLKITKNAPGSLKGAGWSPKTSQNYELALGILVLSSGLLNTVSPKMLSTGNSQKCPWMVILCKFRFVIFINLDVSFYVHVGLSCPWMVIFCKCRSVIVCKCRFVI